MADPRLKPWAAHSETSRGRVYEEAPPASRSAFQRDRDRVIHSTAFRRLVYKTQVFVNHEGDLYRTRLTHSLEVAQIARTVALALGLNETLVEAICLAHDLGHTPFGHAGQDALNACLREHGGFEHNLQSLRVVDELEEKYAEFPGLNLTFETREGILKHCSKRNAARLGELGRRFIERTQPGAEAQLADLADAIAYNNHDIDDGLRAGLLSLDQLRTESLFAEQYDNVEARYPELDQRRRIHEIIRRMIGTVVRDLTESSAERIAELNPADIDDIRAANRRVIAFSDGMAERHASMKRFLHANLYEHRDVVAMTTGARRIVRDLFEQYMAEPRLLPDHYFDTIDGDESARARVVADYIAGMTDRYAIAEHRSISGLDTPF